MRPPICIPCAREMKVHEVGVEFKHEHLNDSDHVIAGDIYKCHGCRHRVATGFASQQTMFEWTSSLLKGSGSTPRLSSGHMPADWPAIENNWKQSRDKFLDMLDELVGEHIPF